MNVMWTVDSLVLVAGGWVQPTTLGTAFVIGQALAVAALAGAEFAGLRRSLMTARGTGVRRAPTPA